MENDILLRQNGMRILLDNLGLVESERFIMLIQREAFDYTKWHENLFEGMTVCEISEKAAEYGKINNLDYDL